MITSGRDINEEAIRIEMSLLLVEVPADLEMKLN
jgi:hypothetical protein